MKDGEIYDAGRCPSYVGKAKITEEKIIPTSSNNVNICEKERFEAKLIVTPKGKRILDFGQNIAGYITFSIQGKKDRK